MIRLGHLRSAVRATRGLRSPLTTYRAFATSQRALQAVADATRAQPAPSFNITPIDVSLSSPTSPLNSSNAAAKDMDDSFIGLSGGEIFHEMMRRHKVDTVFGYPGGAILPVFDAIYNSPHFNFVLPRHEQGAGHMAEGYAKASGKPGVVLVTSGPGATNVITPMQDALSDGIPLVVFCGQVATTAIGTDAFQEADVIGISRSCTKWNVMVKNVAELPKRINEAFEIATSGRPGPVLVDLPKDVTAAILHQAIPMKSSIPSRSLASITDAAALEFQTEAIEKVANLINKAENPVIYAGNGVLATPEGPQLLKMLADKANIPVTTTLHGLGAFDEGDPKALHMLGMHGTGYANMAMQNADLIIALGARFDDRVTGNLTKFAPAAKLAALQNRGGIVHFDISAKNVNKVVQTTEAVLGDVSANLTKLIPLLDVDSGKTPARAQWFDRINSWKEKYPLDYELDATDGTGNGLIKPQTVIRTLSKLTQKQKTETGLKTIITTGVGQHQMWTAQHYRWDTPRTMITSGGLGTMGYGLPAAIGAKVAFPDANVIDIDGDASFNMTLMELSTAVQHGINVKILVLNNEEQGMVTQWQTLFYQNRYAHTHQTNPDFVKLADAMGMKGMKIDNFHKLEEGLQEMLDYNEGPVLVEVMVDQKVPLLPMVPAGKGLDEFLVYTPKE
ncbi:acetolactate synthase [Nadsonia fulvescens var. elongata DSM 6958]|uniref:Acetolactate synthase n=1 Tax=Nadsonia fulvescens var. elongata DSM 6958 TaxID=857566 RepID=A0A1E3PEA0_9ASCO|nr:acetolactate synthase [Nadsonia fulvescens var. elongata DSM 6958]